MSSEAQRYAEAIPLERERLAFDKTHTAWIAVENQFSPFGHGQPT